MASKRKGLCFWDLSWGGSCWALILTGDIEWWGGQSSPAVTGCEGGRDIGVKCSFKFSLTVLKQHCDHSQGVALTTLFHI